MSRMRVLPIFGWPGNRCRRRAWAGLRILLCACSLLTGLGIACPRGGSADPVAGREGKKQAGREGNAKASPEGEPSAAVAERVERLIRQLGSESFEAREQADKELIAIGPPALAALGQALKSADAEIARRARICIPRIERNAKVASLVEQLLKGARPESRAQAADQLMELGQLGKPALEAIPALMQALDDPDRYVRVRAIVALRHMGPAAKSAVPKLMEILKDEQAGEELRWSAAIALGAVGPEAAPAIPLLLKVLRTEVPGLRNGAANALGDIGRNEKEVVPALIQALKHPDPRVSSAAAGALGTIGKEPSSSIPALVEMLRDNERYQGSSDPRECALYALGKFGPVARPAVPVITKLVTDKREPDRIRRRAIETLGELGPAAKEAVPALRALIEAKYLSGEAARALEAIEASKNDPEPRRE
jgi:HEAT repeat protein